MELQGPKLRVGNFFGGKANLVKSEIFKLDMNIKKGDNQRVSLPHPEIFAALNPGMPLLLDDGRIKLKILDLKLKLLNCELR